GCYSDREFGVGRGAVTEPGPVLLSDQTRPSSNQDASARPDGSNLQGSPLHHRRYWCASGPIVASFQERETRRGHEVPPAPGCYGTNPDGPAPSTRGHGPTLLRSGHPGSRPDLVAFVSARMAAVQ